MSRAAPIVALAALLAMSSARAGEPTAARAYEQARRPYFALKASAERRRYRHHWLKAIAAFRQVATEHPGSREAQQALYSAADLWAGLYQVSRRSTDLEQAIAAYGRVAGEYPGGKLADDALWQRSRLELTLRHDRGAAARSIQQLLARYPQGDMATRAKIAWRDLAPALQGRGPADDDEGRPLVGRRDDAAPAVTLTALRHWANPSYSRVVLYLTGPAEARDRGEVGTSAAHRVVVDIAGASLGSGLASSRSFDDDLLSRARLETRPSGGVRLSLDLGKPAQHRLLVLENPYRVVVDAFTAEAPRDADATRPRRVVLDAGHGGHDSGARATTGLLEKDVTLALVRDVEKQLEARGIEVVLTRDDDRYVGLEERTAIANRAAADLFVSIHTNAYTDPKARGTETYYLDTTDDRFALKLAARENATQEEQVSDVQLSLADLATRVSARDSRALAMELQKSMIGALRHEGVRSRDLGVKGSLFYVLLGARMPAVLIETAFLSNPDEARLLGDPAQRRLLAAAIAQAIGARLASPMVAAAP